MFSSEGKMLLLGLITYALPAVALPQIIVPSIGVPSAVVPTKVVPTVKVPTKSPVTKKLPTKLPTKLPSTTLPTIVPPTGVVPSISVPTGPAVTGLPPVVPGGLPFNKIVAFGDDYTDDSSGSFAHGITGTSAGKNKQLWGFGTWTDGLVAVTQLSKMLNIPIAYDFAWGSSGGAEKIGSVCSNDLLNASRVNGHAFYNGALVPDVLQQIQNYSSSPSKEDIENTLHFYWTGNNDVIASLGWLGRFTICADGLCIPGQDRFVANVANCMMSGLKNLINMGAKYIVVPNVYPRQLTPWTSIWIVQKQSYIDNYGTVIDKLNAQLQQNIKTLNANNKGRGVKILYYDVNSFMKAGSMNPPLAGVTAPGYNNTCVDGCPLQNPTKQGNWGMWWNNTLVHKKPDDFYWFTEVVASATVHKAIASQMVGLIQDFFG